MFPRWSPVYEDVDVDNGVELKIWFWLNMCRWLYTVPVYKNTPCVIYCVKDIEILLLLLLLAKVSNEWALKRMEDYKKSIFAPAPLINFVRQNLTCMWVESMQTLAIYTTFANILQFKSSQKSFCLKWRQVTILQDIFRVCTVNFSDKLTLISTLLCLYNNNN